METFFCDEDYQAVALMAGLCGKFIWCHCLMTNHTHLIAAPEAEDDLSMAIGEAHRRFSVMINRRQEWTAIWGRED